jgi:hypothetical protein
MMKKIDRILGINAGKFEEYDRIIRLIIIIIITISLLLRKSLFFLKLYCTELHLTACMAS